MKYNILMAAFVAAGCLWAFFTGDIVIPWALSFVAVPAYFLAHEGRL